MKLTWRVCVSMPRAGSQHQSQTTTKRKKKEKEKWEKKLIFI